MATPTTPTILHGGAERLPVRWRNVDEPPARLSLYRVAPGEAVSTHVHTGKTEYWLIIAGTGVVRVGEETIPVTDGDVVVTPPTVPHGLSNTGTSPLIFVNIVHPTGDVPITSVEVGA